MNMGNWNVNVNTKGLPQKVASAMSSLGDTIMGAQYEMIAYLGSQIVNGTNHAVLAKQTIVTGRDTENIVLLIFNEKPNDPEASLVSIERVVESGSPMGGTKVDVHINIPADAQAEWNDAFMGFVGSDIEPFALLGTQIVKGVNYIFAAEMSPLTTEPKKEAVLVIVNGLTKRVSFVDILSNKHQSGLGYAFTW